jgi:uncharacterized protein YigE (DUF2233 family)
MKFKEKTVMVTKVGILLFVFSVFSLAFTTDDERFVVKIVDLKSENLQLYWKNKSDEPLKTFANLQAQLKSKNQKLVFAMNGGMFKKDFSPQGLYIENFKELNPIDTFSGNGNFYMKPNGVFYVYDKNIPFITITEDFVRNSKIKFATQSGPMLVINGEIHKSFKKGSANLNIRNGVGILPDNKVVLVMSKKEINFYDFAEFFKSLGCKQALYLDGFVSRVYYPEMKWIQEDGNFGVMIGISEQLTKNGN